MSKKRKSPRTVPMRFVELDTGCFVCVSHKTNPTGYLYKTWGDGGDRVREYFHRFIYRAHKGEIPEGWDVDHVCGTQACCNPRHLRALSRREHQEVTQWATMAEREERSRIVWETSGRLASPVEVAEATSCNPRAIKRWIGEWLAETDDWKAEYATQYGL